MAATVSSTGKRGDGGGWSAGIMSGLQMGFRLASNGIQTG